MRVDRKPHKKFSKISGKFKNGPKKFNKNGPAKSGKFGSKDKKLDGKSPKKFEKSKNLKKNEKFREKPKKRKHEESVDPAMDAGAELEAKIKPVVDHEDPETGMTKKKSKHKRRKITDEKDLNQMVTLKNLNQDILKYYTYKLRHKLTELEENEKKFSHHLDHCYFLEENETLENFLSRSKVEISHANEHSNFNIITISSSAIRAVDLKRIFDEIKSDSRKIIKLFGKHMKLKDQIELRFGWVLVLLNLKLTLFQKYLKSGTQGKLDKVSSKISFFSCQSRKITNMISLFRRYLA